MVDLVNCWKCGKNVSSMNASVDLKTRDYICKSCKAAEIAAKNKPVERPVSNNKTMKECNHCGFSYKYDALKEYPLRCPYCNKKESLF